jgi:hypothetical protein
VSAALGVSVAFWLAPSYETVAATAPPGPVSVKLDAVIVVASIGAENVAVGAVETSTPVAPPAGVVAVTVGAGGADWIVQL